MAALLIALFSLLIPYKFEGARDNALMFSVASASVASILAYRFVIQTLMPQVGYMTTTDYVFLLCLVVSTVIFLVHVLFFIALMQRSIKLRKAKAAVRETAGEAVAVQVNVLSAGIFFVVSIVVAALLYKMLLG